MGFLGRDVITVEHDDCGLFLEKRSISISSHTSQRRLMEYFVLGVMVMGSG